MSKRTTFVCDACGHTTDERYPKGWFTLQPVGSQAYPLAVEDPMICTECFDRLGLQLKEVFPPRDAGTVFRPHAWDAPPKS